MPTCPACNAENEPTTQTCAACGRILPLPAGKMIASRFEILDVVGRGGMGVVYRARDHTLDETVALKVLRADLIEGDELGRRFRSEIKVARRVGHRNVCRVFEYGEDGPIRYIAMELIDGVNLRHFLTHTGALPLSEAFETVLQAVHGLEAIHELGVVHRDLKSANIMRDRRGVVKLMDFGIARQRGVEGGDLTGTGAIVGTPEYMSPEQATGAKVDSRSDIYSMGVIIYEVFTGVVPFRGDTPVATILKHIQEPLVLKGTPGLPDALLPVLGRCLAKLPKDRYATATGLRQALEAACSQAVSGAPTVPKLAVAQAAPSESGDTHTLLRTRPRAGVDLTLRPSPTQMAPGRSPWGVQRLALVALLPLAGALAVYYAMSRQKEPAAPASLSDASSLPLVTPAPLSPATGAPTPAVSAPAPTPLQTQRPPAPTPDRASEVAVQLARVRDLDPERAYGQVLALASRHPADRRVREQLDVQQKRLVVHWVASGREALAQAASGTAEEPYRRAADYFDRALELDPANGDAQSGRAAAVRGPSRPQAPSDRVAFVLGDTTFTPSPMTAAPAGMGELPPGVQVRPAQPPAPQARIVIEIAPQPLRPGESFVARYYVFNQSQASLSLMAASLRNVVGGGAATGGRVELASKLAPPNTRTLLLETKDTWRHDPSSSWATTLTLVLEDGSVYSGTLHTQR